MSEYQITVAVCIASIGRESLIDTVESVLEQELGPKFTLDIFIADDSLNKEISHLLDSFDKSERIWVVPCGKGNVAIARNCALEKASKFDLIAFIDDDEVADRDWIISLYEALESEGADVAFGPVEPVYEKSCPDWANAAGLFRKRPGGKKGRLKTGATSNVLFRNSILEKNIRFDPQFGLTGGEDTVFFAALYRSGISMVGVEKGFVRERVSPQRLELDAIKERYKRGGHTNAFVHAQEYGVSTRVIFLIRAILKTAIFYILSSLTFKKSLKVKYSLSYWLALGEIGYFFGFKMKNLYGR